VTLCYHLKVSSNYDPDPEIGAVLERPGAGWEIGVGEKRGECAGEERGVRRRRGVLTSP